MYNNFKFDNIPICHYVIHDCKEKIILTTFQCRPFMSSYRHFLEICSVLPYEVFLLNRLQRIFPSFNCETEDFKHSIVYWNRSPLWWFSTWKLLCVMNHCLWSCLNQESLFLWFIPTWTILIKHCWMYYWTFALI